MHRLTTVLLALALTACSHKQTVETARAVSDSYQASYRDNVIHNWQKHIENTPECASYRDQMWTDGQKHPSAASGAFVNNMHQIRDAAKIADCTSS